MASMESVSAAIDAVPAMKEALRRAFDDLEPFKSPLAGFSLRWDEIEEHFDARFNFAKSRFSELADAVKAANSSLNEEKDETTVEKDDAEQEASLPVSREKKDETRVKAYGPKLTSSLPASMEHGKEPQTALDSWEAALRLKRICGNMDDYALTRFVVEQDSGSFPREEEIILALRSAPDPVKLVLDFMEGFKPDEVDTAKDIEGSSLLRGSLRLLGALAELKPHVSNPAKERGKTVAGKWRKRALKLHNEEDSDQNSVAFAIQVYIKFLATLGLISHVGVEELSEMVECGSQYKGMMKLCRKLGFSHRMPAVIEHLSMKGDYLPAVEIAFLFKLCDKYPPVPLLNKYVQDIESKFYNRMGKGDAKARVEAINDKLEEYRLLIVTVQKCNIYDFQVPPLKQKMTDLREHREKELMAMLLSPVEQKKPQQHQDQKKPQQHQDHAIIVSSVAPVPTISDLSKEMNNGSIRLAVSAPRVHDSLRSNAAIIDPQPELLLDRSSLVNSVFEQKPVGGNRFRTSQTSSASLDPYHAEKYLPADRPSPVDRSLYDPFKAHQDDPLNVTQDSLLISLTAGSSYRSPPHPISGLSSDTRNVRRRTDSFLGSKRLSDQLDASGSSLSGNHGSDNFSSTTASRYHSDFLLGNPYNPPSS